MALFSSKTAKKHTADKLAGEANPAHIKAPKKAKAKPMAAAVTSPVVKVAKAKDVQTPVVVSSSVIIAPHITEKAGIQSETMNVYTFKVTPLATKGSITKAIKAQFKVTPVKVNITTRPDKTVNVRGRKAVKSGFKKASVYLKKGDKIEFA